LNENNVNMMRSERLPSDSPSYPTLESQPSVGNSKSGGRSVAFFGTIKTTNERSKNKR